MVSERAFGSALVRRRVTNQCELSFSDETMRRPSRVLCHAQLLSAEQRHENQLRHILRQWRNRRNDQRGRAAEEDRHGQRLIHLLGRVIVKAAAFLNLPMQTRSRGVVNLHAIDAEVVLLRRRMFRIDERQSDERPTVFLPGSQHRKLIETRRLLNDFTDWATRNRARAEFQEIANQRTMLPELLSIRRQ